MSLLASSDTLYFIFLPRIQLPQKNIRIKVLDNPALFPFLQRHTNSRKAALVFLKTSQSSTYHFADVIITPACNVCTDKLLKMGAQSNSYSSWHKQSIYKYKCKNKSYITQVFHAVSRFIPAPLPVPSAGGAAN